jgi:hypothetical protein
MFLRCSGKTPFYVEKDEPNLAATGLFDTMLASAVKRRA